MSGYCHGCGRSDMAGITHICPPPGMPVPRMDVVTLDAKVWTQIVWAARESEDWRLRTLIEQAVMGSVQR